MCCRELFSFVAVLSLFMLNDVSQAAEGLNRPQADRTVGITSKADNHSHNLTLRFIKVKRDPVVSSMATLTFELTPGRGYPFSVYDPGLELLEGLSGLWRVKGSRQLEWRKTRYGEKKWLVHLRVHALKPGETELRYLRVRLHYKGRPREGDFRTSEFQFDRIPLDGTAR